MDAINDTTNSVVGEYAALPYEKEHLVHMPTFEIQFSISDQLFLDVLLMKIRIKTISFAKTKKRTNEGEKKEVENCIQSLEKKVI